MSRSSGYFEDQQVPELPQRREDAVDGTKDNESGARFACDGPSTMVTRSPNSLDESQNQNKRVWVNVPKSEHQLLTNRELKIILLVEIMKMRREIQLDTLMVTAPESWDVVLENYFQSLKADEAWMSGRNWRWSRTQTQSLKMIIHM
ncbi:hypothetical protein CERSUDRAFT_77854 [Gelatoporia subvermispora B]|uniref:Uncharacterized protein n=1 Tax=Ceriporiopsis subvermispora (strain B) TaxID=914234 RepID=M2P8N8_CERS8|nr:hypothetical protein CERSUDRAFT_77854 [Gelatoporia subvermispora B]